MNINKMKVMPGKIFGEILSNEEITEGGLIITTRIKEIPRKAKVLKVGPGKRDKKGKIIESCVKPGEVAYFKKNFGFKWREEQKEYIFLRNDEITGVSDE